MHKGVWIGENACERGVLILGESHHGGDELGNEATYTSEKVVQAYLDAKQGLIKWDASWTFFTKIARAVEGEINNEQLIDFWQHMYFGNYIDVICGVKDKFAKSYFKKAENRKKLNSSLFSFVYEYKINSILCVSNLAYRNLPPLTEEEKKLEITLQENPRILFCEYNKNTLHDYSDVSLNDNLKVISIKHPSGFGFVPKAHYEVLSKLL